MQLEDQISVSPYLSRLAKRCDIPVDESREELLARLDSIVVGLQKSPLADDALDFPQAEQRLLSAKQDFAFAWSLAELQNVGSQPARGILQTRFAEASIDYALRLSWRLVLQKQASLRKVITLADGIVPGLFIFGMGKLGGNDLNFSSDVDLVAYFDPDVLPVPDMLGKSYICHQVLQGLSKLLGQGGSADFVWRVDWRLRPNASATSLAMSSVVAEDYYHYRASPWHRLALMKARVIAGDKELGQRFLDSLDSFIWRQNLDYRALDELAEIKQKINLEHPSLRAQRRWQQPIGDDISGFDVKLGSGGIREIEFFANAQQLLWGGRRTELRVPNTVDALRELSAFKRLDSDLSERLIKCYQFLRRVENALQMHGNQHTHLIPSSEENQQDILCLLGNLSWSSLVEEMNGVREFVNGMFLELFAEREESAEHAVDLVWPKGLTQQADEIVEAWENGFYLYGVSNQVRHRLKPLAYALANYLHGDDDHSGPEASEVIVRLHDFFRSLPQGEQYFRLLAESPKLLHSIVPPLLYSPPMVTLLKQSPHIVDCYVHGEWHYPAPFDSGYIFQTDDYGERLERLRRFVNEHLYQLYQQFLQGGLVVEAFQAALSELARQTLELALDVVRQGMGLETVPITVLGMGKVALGRMSPMSDLDLIFIYDAQQVSLELASRFVSRLQTAIASPMREGIVYELDTRLRPSGRSGAPTVSVDSFATHHRERAHTWEHIALMPSKVVAGDASHTTAIEAIKAELIRQPRSLTQLRNDARKMWERIIEHRVDDTPLSCMNSKLRPGGLMQAEYLAACLILDFGQGFTVKSVDFDELLIECLPHYGVPELPEIIQFWRTQQLWERLLGKQGEPLSSLRDQYFVRLLQQSGCNSMDELLAKKRRYADYVIQALEDFFADSLALSSAELEQWQEESVRWVDS